MGFALTLLYLVTTYLGTETVFGPLVAYHVELIIALLVILISLPSIPRSFLLKTPQTFALIGLAIAVFLSVLATGWYGGAVKAFQNFIPNAFAYYLVCLHCKSRARLRIIIFLLLFVCLFVIARGVVELRAVPDNVSHEEMSISPYLLGQHNDDGQWFYRIRGQNLLNDPNDFAQLLACVIPLVFVFWRPKKLVGNLLFVLLPVCALVWGAYLTHSRGFLLAFLAMAIVAGRRRVGIIPSLIGAALLFVAASWMNFTGGRDVSIDAGSGRMVLWGSGLGLFKSHLLFGVGYGNLSDYLGLTAHNSIVVCAAELGAIGLYFWTLFLFPTLNDTRSLTLVAAQDDNEAILTKPAPAGTSKRGEHGFDRAEIKRVGELILLSFTGFLTAGFFLSRAFVLTFFLLGGITEVLFEMARERQIIPPRLKWDRVLSYSGVLSVVLVVGVYVIVRLSFLSR